METILGDVFTWSWFSDPHGYNFNSLLIPDLDETSASIRSSRTIK